MVTGSDPVDVLFGAAVNHLRPSSTDIPVLREFITEVGGEILQEFLEIQAGCFR